MTFKKLIIILTITVSLLITALLGTSYAWYQFDNAVTSFNDVSTYSENLGTTVVFENSANINSKIELPLSEQQIARYSQKTRFTLTLKPSEIGERDIAYQISLIDIKIDEELTATKDLKYSLIQTVNGNSKEIKSGNFENFTGDNLILKEMSIPEEFKDEYREETNNSEHITYNYEFRLWLQDNECTLSQINDPNDDCKNQNDLMGKSISGTIKVSSALN